MFAARSRANASDVRNARTATGCHRREGALTLRFSPIASPIGNTSPSRTRNGHHRHGCALVRRRNRPHLWLLAVCGWRGLPQMWAMEGRPSRKGHTRPHSRPRWHGDQQSLRRSTEVSSYPRATPSEVSILQIIHGEEECGGVARSPDIVAGEVPKLLKPVEHGVPMAVQFA